MSATDHTERGASPTGMLRVGVLLDERRILRWHATALAEILRLGFCDLTVFTCRPAGVAPVRERMPHWLYSLYTRADRRAFGSNDALAPASLPSADGRPLQVVRLDGDPTASANLGTLSSAQLDVLLCLAPDLDAERLAAYGRHGAWALYAGGLRGRSGEAQLFWQMYDADFVAPITLRAHTEAEGRRDIYRSVVQPDLVSLHRSRCRAAQRAAHLPARRLRDLHERGWPFVLASNCPHDPEPARSRPTTSMMARFMWRVARGVAARRLEGRMGEKQWFIAYRRVAPGPPAAGDSPLTTIMPPAGRFYADPFLFEHDGRRFIFFEDYDGSCGRAEIRYVEIDKGGRHCKPQLALRQDVHLSYPFVFTEGDSVYLLPETAGRRQVELWRATDFPTKWELDRVLLHDVYATDATLVRHAGRLWLFVAIDVDGRRATEELFLFSSDSLHGEWEPHPLNPIVSDVRRARPAGRIFAQNGHLVRPAQDCSRAYGWRLVFNRIEELSPSDYREAPMSAIEPALDTGNLRTHSYDSDGTYEVLDGFRMRPRVTVGAMSRASARPSWRRVELESPSVLDG